MSKSAIAAALLALAMAATVLADNAPIVITRKGIDEATLPWRYIDSPIHPVDNRRIKWHIGWFEVKTPIGPLRVLYLPIAPPLHYSPGSRDWNEMPNAFVLTGMQIPQRPPKEEPPKTDIEVRKPEQ
ncbi:MAG TPA: hypothetical protein VG323_07725 [Thermoanaerobaculia bacterium]|nr:hypothetical protein [Thermoanaerobaculia bacterium]